MAEYIEREHLKDKFTRYLNAPHVRSGYSVGQGMRVAIKTCIAMLDEEPTAEVVPVRHGEWTRSEDDWYSLTTLTCSECHEEWYFETEEDVELLNYRYCPNCGARCDLEG